MGPAGSGKSSVSTWQYYLESQVYLANAIQFINLATGNDQVIIGHSLRPCTHEIQAFSCPYPKDSSRNVVFIDTPGFDIRDGTYKGDTEILQAVDDLLVRT